MLRMKEAIAEGHKFAGPDGKKFSQLQPAGKFFAVAFTGLQYLALVVTVPVAFVWGIAILIPQCALACMCNWLGKRNWLIGTIVALHLFSWPAILVLSWKYGDTDKAPKWLRCVAFPALAVTERILKKEVGAPETIGGK
jgi:hypothetical protein